MCSGKTSTVKNSANSKDVKADGKGVVKAGNAKTDATKPTDKVDAKKTADRAGDAKTTNLKKGVKA